MADLELLKQEYLLAFPNLNEEQRARGEEAIWQAYLALGQTGGCARRDWLHRTLGGSLGYYQRHSQLLAADAVIRDVWDLLNAHALDLVEAVREANRRTGGGKRAPAGHRPPRTQLAVPVTPPPPQALAVRSPPTGNVAALVARYRAERPGLRSRALAQLEDDIFSSLDASIPCGAEGRGAWFVREFPGLDHASAYRTRYALLVAGALADPLWQALDAKLIPVSAARELLTEARKDPDPAAALARRLGERIAQRNPLDGRAELRESARVFLAHVTAAAESLVTDYATGLDAASLDMQVLVGNFTLGVQVCCEELQATLSRTRNTSKETQRELRRVTRATFSRACEVLGVHDWQFGTAMDEAARAARRADLRRRHISRVRTLHPDHNHGGRQHERELAAVLEASEVLNRYLQQR